MKMGRRTHIITSHSNDEKEGGRRFSGVKKSFLYSGDDTANT